MNHLITPPLLNDLSLQIISKINQKFLVSKKKASQIRFTTFEKINFNEFRPTQNYNLIDHSIRQHIDGCKKIGRIYNFNINDRNISLYIILPIYSLKKRNYTHHSNYTINPLNNKTIKIDSNYYNFQKIIRKVYSILLFFITHTNINVNCSNKLSIFLYLSNLKKLLPQSRSSLNSIRSTNIDKKNVNTGFTFGCSYMNEIYVYRKEEWEKVLIHELIHAFGLDFASQSELNNIANNQMLKFFNFNEQLHDLNKDIKIYEAYTETWATIINIIFQDDLSKSQTGDKKNDISKIIKKIHNQQIWSMIQYLKLMRFYRLDNLIFENEKQIILKEKVTLYSYYILKCRFLLYINDFFGFYIKDKNQLIDFKKTKENVNKFTSFIINEIYCINENGRFEKTILKLMKECKDLVKITYNTNKYEIKHSLKMTI